MKKVCIVCGYSIESNVKECPNCGSYNFKEIKDDSSEKFRRFRYDTT